MLPEQEGTQIDFVTLGMFIIDDIYPPPTAADQTPKTDIIGGAGTYSAIGARLFSPPPHQSKSIGWIVDKGTDFPPDLLDLIASWQTGALIRPRDALTTRGWNGYGENEHRAFKYLTEKKRLTADDLTPELLASRSFHLICSPLRCVQMVERIHVRRQEAFGGGLGDPVIIWEPVPDLCTPGELPNTFQALKHVDVVSPNHEELGSLFGYKHGSGVDREAVEEQAAELCQAFPAERTSGVVVVRCGAVGCYVLPKPSYGAADKPAGTWLPAYHRNASRVIDPTGGGNGFLGGLAVGLVRHNGDVVEAARWGSIAASFCIEQVGVPEITSRDTSDERWNDESVHERLESLKGRS
ncbi:pfkB family carbohydrate kinase [Teratosphaeria destructans]|uniref:PfkB family carbohydrate kinase n=1 Tax=Teratosphaeria destructans TaxID=418781 RepID=A0A9W7SPR6_9PEZI|nr:pfkB family carbohydrate kinase [Teratosphaeria destructans]